jgi:mannose-6-phosphate isomerase
VFVAWHQRTWPGDDIMASVYVLTPALQAYDWGTNDVIAELLGLDSTDRPVAEAWWGAHPDAPALASTANGAMPLTDVIAADAVGALGDHVARQWGGALPYLLKVLSISKPLSIQVHPSAEQAQAGYDKERATGRAQQSALRYFADGSAKPELVVALSPVVALAGFRPVADLAKDLAVIDAPMASALRDALTSEGGIARYLAAVLALPQDAPMLNAMTTVALAPEASGELRAAAGALDHHPGDAGALIALALNRVDLAPGQALFIDAGVVHSYQSGTALEVMANSDNVVRAGLTSKPVNSDLFLALADTAVRAPQLIEPVVRGGARSFVTPACEYALTLVTHDTVPRVAGPRVVLAIAGSAVVTTAGESVTLSQGQAVFVPAGEGDSSIAATDLAAVVSVP